MTKHEIPIMNAELRRVLLECVDREGWDDEYKTRMRAAIAELRDLDAIPEPTTDDFEEDGRLEITHPVYSMVEYFGVYYLY